MYQILSMLSDLKLIVRAAASASSTTSAATRLWLQLGANVTQTAVVHLNGEISCISFSRVRYLAGALVE